jgi:hypothetical protein
MENDYKVADISLAEFGRREISLAENEMPALMALRDKYRDEQPLGQCKNYGLYSYDNSNCGFNGNINRFRRRTKVVFL